MEKWDFGITMLVVGMGGTLLTLWILSLFVVLLRKIFPLSPGNGTPGKKG
ncbi:MAG: OadG family protein [Pseudomonadota bacterium]